MNSKPRARLRAAAGVFLLLAATGVVAQTPIEHTLAPGRTYDPAVPAPTRSLGYALGQDLATYAEMAPYFERLAASSRRVRLATHGESYEGRPIYDITITSPENHARIDQIKANLARLADPRKLSGPQELENLARNTPVVVMLVFGTDGAETAGPEAAIQLAYQLAAGTDARTQAMLRDAVVIIVPAENPDANQRAVAWYNAFRVGANGTGDPDAAEHQFPWGINSNNHYQIDPNRESVWGILRESRAMIGLYRQWNPQVYVDNHGEHTQYTGPWYVEPLHDVLTTNQREWHHKFGEAMQAEFKKRGYIYAPWEFGQFDPGYWDTYPNFSGSIGWTTETTGGGSRGLRLDRREAPAYTLADGIIQHVIALDVTIALAASNREQLLRDFHAYKTSALEEGARASVKAYALSAKNDPSAIAAVLSTMNQHGIEVQRTTRDLPLRGARSYFHAAANTLPVGSYIIPTAQPQHRMLRVLMEPEAKFSPDFLAQIAKAQADTTRNAGRLFYDITAWSLPHTYNLDAYELTEAVPSAALATLAEKASARAEVLRPNASHGFVIDYGSNAAIGALARLRREGVVYRVAPEAFTIDGKRFPAGSAVILRADNSARDLAPVVRAIAEGGVAVTGIESAATSSTLRLDSASLARAASGRIAVVMDRPVSPSSYGHIWYTFEQRYGIDFTALNFDRLANVNLDKYSVLILPDGNYGGVQRGMAADVAAKLRAFVERGGTVIGIRGGSAWLATAENNITATRTRAAGRRQPAIPGSIFRATITDPKNSLTYGYETPAVPVMVWSALAFEPGASAEAPIRIADSANARVSGFVFPESLTHLAGTPYVVRERRGQGAVILFLDDPNFRLFWDGLSRLFMNAVLLK